MSAEQNKAIVRRALENFNNPAARTAYLELYAADCVYYGLPPGLPPGIEGLKQFYGGYWTAFPDAQVTIEDLIAEGEMVACRFTFQGTHQGDLMGIPPTGRRVTISGTTILRLVNGKCVERWNEADFLGLMQQLGVVPAPEGAGG